MRSLLLLTFVCALFAQVFASNVIDLSQGDFNTNVAKYETVLVDFFAPWCHYCKALEPEYEAAATNLARSSPKVHLAKVDCVASPHICSANGVRGYPTVKLFKSGHFTEAYNGARQRDAIVQYMKNHA